MTNDMFKKEYPIVGSGDNPPLLFSSFQPRMMHRGNWLHYFIDRDMSPYLDFNTDLTEFTILEDGKHKLKLNKYYPIKATHKYLAKVHNVSTYLIIAEMLKKGKHLKIANEYVLKGASPKEKGMMYYKEESGGQFILRCPHSRKESESYSPDLPFFEDGDFIDIDILEKDLYETTKEAILTAIFNMTYSLINNIWDSKTDNPNPKPSASKSQKLMVYGKAQTKWFINKVNPFFEDILMDDVHTYANVLTAIEIKTNYPVFETSAKTYKQIYLDFNGSYSFFTNDIVKTWIQSNRASIKGCYMMGGVETHEAPHTISMYSVKRYSCATVNQVYHPDGTKQLFNFLKETQIPLICCTNNAINQKESIWDIGGKDVEIEAVSVVQLFRKISHLIPDNKTLLKMIFAYYADGGKPMKLFDVPVAIALAYDVLGKTPVTTSKKLLYCDYGVTLVYDASITEFQKPLQEYLNHLTEKWHPFVAEAMQDEFNFFQNALKSNQINECACESIDLDSLKDLQTIANDLGITNTIYGKVDSLESIIIKDPKSIPEDIINDLTAFKLYFFSDEEGGNPFKVELGNNNNDSNLKDFTITNGIITNTADNVKVVFLGDVQDNSKYNIRLLQSFVNLHDKKKAILIAGNRDINKLRLADEHFLIYKGNPAIHLQQNATFTEHINKLFNNQSNLTFKWKMEHLVPDVLDKYNTKSGVVHFDRDIASRVKQSYLDTFAAFNIDTSKRFADPPPFAQHPNVEKVNMTINRISAMEFIYDELVELQVIDEQEVERQAINIKTEKPNDEYKAIAVALFNMIASRKWAEDVLSKLTYTDINNDISDMNTFSGLYLKYLEASNLAYVFKHQDKYGLISHAGLNRFDTLITDDLGFSEEVTRYYSYLIQDKKSTLDPINTVSIAVVVKNLNEKMRSTLAVQNENYSEMFRKSPDIVRLIHMSAQSKYHHNQIDHTYLHHALSPVVGFNLPRVSAKNTRSATKTTMTIGGSGARAKARPYTTNPQSNSKTITYHIYGHQPRGLVPSVYKVGDTYHICMDVSKIEGQTNSNSYALFCLSNVTDSEPTFLGKIDYAKLKQQFSKQDGSNTVLFSNSDEINTSENIEAFMCYNISLEKLASHQQEDKTLAITYGHRYNLSNDKMYTSSTHKVDVNLSMTNTKNYTVKFYTRRDKGDLNVNPQSQHSLVYYSQFIGATPFPIYSTYIVVHSHTADDTSALRDKNKTENSYLEQKHDNMIDFILPK